MPALDLLASEDLTPAVRSIVQSAPLPGLGEGPVAAQTATEIEQLLAGDDPFLASLSSSGRELALAGLWLLAGGLERSHVMSQNQSSDSGSYWHGIMHRREGDYGNALYWFRRAGQHPVMGQLSEHIAQHAQPWQHHRSLNISQLSQPRLVAEKLTELYEQACRGASTRRQPAEAAACTDFAALLQLMGWWEWQLLFAFCIRSARGS